MKNLENIKKYLIGFIIGLLGIGTFAYAADRGSIGVLFEEINGEWFLNGENIKSNSVGANQLLPNVDVNECGDEQVLGGDGDCHDKSWGNTTLTEEAVDAFVSNNGYLTSVSTPTFNEVLVSGNTTTKNIYIGTNRYTTNDIYISDNIIDWDNYSYYLNPNEESRLYDLKVDNLKFHTINGSATVCNINNVGGMKIKGGYIYICKSNGGGEYSISPYYNDYSYHDSEYSASKLCGKAGGTYVSHTSAAVSAKVNNSLENYNRDYYSRDHSHTVANYDNADTLRITSIICTNLSYNWDTKYTQ